MQNSKFKPSVGSMVLILLTLTLTGCPPKVEQKITKLNDNVTSPTYVPLNIPVSTVPLPGVFIGPQQQIQSTCFSGGGPTRENTSNDSLTFSTTFNSSFQASLQASLERELVQAGLDASFAKATSQEVRVKAVGVTITELTNFTEIKPDFKNAACNTSELEYYVNDRTIVTGALKAKSVEVSTISMLTSEQKSKLDLALKQASLELSLAFRNASTQAGEFRWVASNLYFGALTTKLAVVRCSYVAKSVVIAPAQQFDISDTDWCGKRRLRLTRSQLSTDFTLQAYQADNPDIGSGQINVKSGKPKSISINDVSLGSIDISHIEGNKFSIAFYVTIVGPSGAQVIK